MPEGSAIVLTLDAGGTNFAFNAVQGGKLLLKNPVVLPACGHDLNLSLAHLVEGFKRVLSVVEEHGPVVALSFAFPGPADYEAGIIGDLDNLPAYRGGVPLGPYLREELGLPVFIHNDGDLFAYGVASHGDLKFLNDELEKRGKRRRLRSVLGVTVGTGWGCGFATQEGMFLGSSSTGCEIGTSPWCDERAIEETVSRGGLGRLYTQELQKEGATSLPDPEDPDLAKAIANEARKSRASAACRAFERFAHAFAFGLSWAINLFDPDLVVVGGGLAGAWDLFLPKAVAYLREPLKSGRPRVFKKAFLLTDPKQRESFLKEETEVMAKKKVGITPSSLPTEAAVMLGAYEVAIRSGALP